MSAQAQTKPAEQALSGQQIDAMHKRMADALVSIKQDIELRKLALRHACDMASATGVGSDPITLAKQMHEFLTGGVDDVITRKPPLAS